MLSVNILLAHGGIAQLGERLNGIQEVSGSIPLISTIEALKFLGISRLFAIHALHPDPALLC